VLKSCVVLLASQQLLRKMSLPISSSVYCSVRNYLYPLWLCSIPACYLQMKRKCVTCNTVFILKIIVVIEAKTDVCPGAIENKSSPDYRNISHFASTQPCTSSPPIATKGWLLPAALLSVWPALLAAVSRGAN